MGCVFSRSEKEEETSKKNPNSTPSTQKAETKQQVKSKSCYTG